MDVVFHTRNQDSQVEEFMNLEEALESFLGYDGYRLSIDTDKYSVHIYRDELPMVKRDDNGVFINSFGNDSIYESRILVFKKGDN